MKWMIWGKSTTILGTPHMKRIWNFLSYPLLKASTLQQLHYRNGLGEGIPQVFVSETIFGDLDFLKTR